MGVNKSCSYWAVQYLNSNSYFGGILPVLLQTLPLLAAPPASSHSSHGSVHTPVPVTQTETHLYLSPLHWCTTLWMAPSVRTHVSSQTWAAFLLKTLAHRYSAAGFIPQKTTAALFIVGEKATAPPVPVKWVNSIKILLPFRLQYLSQADGPINNTSRKPDQPPLGYVWAPVSHHIITRLALGILLI